MLTTHIPKLQLRHQRQDVFCRAWKYRRVESLTLTKLKLKECTAAKKGEREGEKAKRGKMKEKKEEVKEEEEEVGKLFFF